MIKAIAAMSLNRVIGAHGKIPWHLSEDLRFFKRTTLGHVVVMGRKTYDSLGKPLPGRENIVVTRGGPLPGVTTIDSPEALVEPTDERDVFIIGGARIYAAYLPRIQEFFLTVVRRAVDGDTYLPPFEGEFTLAETLHSDDDIEIRRYVRN
jgi:dihydrofolate reductase